METLLHMKPLILDFILPRSAESQSIKYKYCPIQQINLVNVNGHSKPYVKVTSSDLEIVTQTKIARESDDQHEALLELKTKTETRRERDDLHDSLLEIKTKTFTLKERDDESSTNNE